MSAIFQRPLCEMGAAYDYALRPLIGDADPGSGGPCDDHPRRVELRAASEGADGAARRSFLLCPEHEAQLRSMDGRLAPRGIASRFTVASQAAPRGPG